MTIIMVNYGIINNCFRQFYLADVNCTVNTAVDASATSSATCINPVMKENNGKN